MDYFYGDRVLKIQTLGILLMKIARKRINWPENTLHVDANVREALDREI